MSIYRMTMKDVYDLTDKDSGDIAGDTSFVLSKKNNAFYCRQNPGDFMCTNLAQFSGDDLNSTDLILEMTIETDGQWGVYLECNPLNGNDSTGRWTCENGLKPQPSPSFPKQCRAIEFSAWDGYCINQEPTHTLKGTQTECCDYISQQPAGTFGAYNYFPSNNTCKLFKEYIDGSSSKCDHSVVVGTYDPPDPNQCNCERIYKAVGRQNQTLHGGSFSITGGEWYSHPSGGECGPNDQLGDKGCTYKVVDIPRAIKATCMYETIDKAVEALNTSCFTQCPKPYNITSDCYLGCYSSTTTAAATSDLVAPWSVAFAANGCPQVPIKQDIKAQMLKLHY